MGGRYIVTGTQLGELLVFCKLNVAKANLEINKIIENQFIGNSENTIQDDVTLIENEWTKRRKERTIN